MATVACPGCGLPRTESEIGTKPCPVCEGAPALAPRARRPKKPVEPDPTAGLPADVSELDAPGALPPPRAAKRPPKTGRRVFPLGAVAFLCGVLCGVWGVLAFQARNGLKPQPNQSELAAQPPDGATAPGGQAAGSRALPVAPMPHGPSAPPPVVGSHPQPKLRPDPGPDLKVAPPQPLRPGITIDPGNSPNLTYSVPALKKGEHFILKSDVRLEKLLVHGLEAGSVLDASGLEASVIIVTGKIDGRSTLKLRAPGGTVHVSAKVDGRSFVAIDAPGGEVRFMLATTAMREGSKVDGGSAVSVTARAVEFRGDIDGVDTHLTVTLTRSGALDIEAVRGQAVVEYRSQAAGWAAPMVRIGSVAATALVRKGE